LRLLRGIIELRDVEVKRLIVLVSPAILVAGLLLLGLSDAGISIADTSIPDNEVVGSIGEADNSSANATSTITMTGAPNE